MYFEAVGMPMQLRGCLTHVSLGLPVVMLRVTALVDESSCQNNNVSCGVGLGRLANLQY
jgi:hypothetical protein